MAKIKVNVDYPIQNGTSITFNAPCDCTATDGLTVYSPDGKQTFSLCDAHGESLAGIGNVFAKGVPVKVILDVVNAKAFVQNGDNNTYLNRILAGFQTEIGSYVGTGKYGSLNANSVTFGFVPKLVFVHAESFANTFLETPYLFMINGVIATSVLSVVDVSNVSTDRATKAQKIFVEWNGNTVSWSNRDSADYQLNIADKKYFYVAIG